MQREMRPIAELERLFVEAFERLNRACILYDGGHLTEAPDIAKEVVTFAYDHGRSTTSILTALKLKEGLRFIDSRAAAEEVPAGATLLSPEYRLMTEYIGFDGIQYVPFLGRGAPCTATSFDDWWHGTVMSRYDAAAIGKREAISRSELALHLRHKEGGAHIEPAHFTSAQNDKMRGLMQGAYVSGYMVFGDSPPVTAEDFSPAYAAMRQIGWELLETLRRGCPELSSRASGNPRIGASMRPGTR